MKPIIEKMLSRVDIMAFLVGVTLMTLLVSITFALIYVPIPKENTQILYILIGIIATGVGTLVNYYFGSAKGSQKKSDLIEKIVDKS